MNAARQYYLFGSIVVSLFLATSCQKAALFDDYVIATIMDPTPQVIVIEPTQEPDLDGDGFSVSEGDCDDTNAAINPNAIEIAYDGIDQDCEDGDLVDRDENGYPSTVVEGGTDCNDEDPAIRPSAAEICNGLDDNCDGVVDLDAVDQTGYFVDEDGDTYGSTPGAACPEFMPNGTSPNGGDCDDTAPAIHPDAVETSCGIDQDCDGDYIPCDNSDDDRDGYAEIHGDCDDTNASVYPGAAEICDDLDNDCDEAVDENLTEPCPSL